MAARRLCAIGGLTVVALLALAGQSWAKNEVTTCTGSFGASASEIVVPAGETCTLEGTAEVKNSVTVQPGASLIDQGATVGKDIKATNPAGIQIGAAKQSVIGHDVKINGLSGSIMGADNYVCNAKIGHDLHAEHSAVTASTLVVGDPPDCNVGDIVAHDIHVQENADKVDVSDSSAGHDIHVQNNSGGVNVSGTSSMHDLHVQNNSGGVVVSNNTAGHNAKCSSNKPATEGEANKQSKGRPKGCPSPPGPPVVKKAEPDQGPTAGGTEVIITGIDLGGATAVKFGSTEALYEQVDDKTIKATSPPGTGKVDIFVTTPQGPSAKSGAHFEYKAK
jgi:hypothetical protein